MTPMKWLVLWLFISSPSQSYGFSCNSASQATQFDTMNGVTCTNFIGTLFTQTGNLTYANSATPTNLIGTGVGSVTLPANFWVPGRQIRIKGRGVYSSASLAPSLNVNIKYGSVSLATATASNLVNNANNAGFAFEEIITCRTTGTTGTVMVDGSLSYSTGTGLVGAVYLDNNAAPITVDTTNANALTIMGTWGTASASNTLTVSNSSIEVLN